MERQRSAPLPLHPEVLCSHQCFIDEKHGARCIQLSLIGINPTLPFPHIRYLRIHLSFDLSLDLYNCTRSNEQATA